MPLDFEVVFSTSVITQIKFIGGGWVGWGGWDGVGVGGGGRWGAVGRVKQTFKLKGQCFAISK